MRKAKLFDGKRYVYILTRKTKREAQAEAGYLREQGHCARVVFDGLGVYRVYARGWSKR